MAIIAFIHIKKTAGKTVKHIMRRELGLRHCDVKRWHRDDEYLDAAGLRRLRRVYPWVRSIAGHSIKPYSDLKRSAPDLKYYTFLRDPIRRTLSQYQYEVQQGRRKDGQFEQWIRDPANHDAQVRTLAGAPDLEKAKALLRDEIAYVGLMEQLHESLAMMLPALGLPAIDYSPDTVNSARDNLIRDRILADPKLMALVEQANRLDLQLYAFVKNEIYPRQQQRFAAALADINSLTKARSGQSYSGQFYLNVTYRQLVYKPVIWLYRLMNKRQAV